MKYCSPHLQPTTRILLYPMKLCSTAIDTIYPFHISLKLTIWTLTCICKIQEDWVLCRVFYKSRTTNPKLPSEDAQDGTPSTEPDLPASLPLAPLTDTYTAFSAASTVTEQVSCFSGLPALPLKRPVSLGDLLAFDTSEKVSIGTVMLSSMPSNSSSELELPPNCNWNHENVLSQLWNPLGIWHLCWWWMGYEVLVMISIEWLVEFLLLKVD